MKTKKLQTYNRFDTLRLKIPSETFSSVDWKRFHHKVKVSGVTKKVDEEDKGKDLLWYTEPGKGISTFTYLPNTKEFDVTLSAKVLREKYAEGISYDTMDKVFQEITDRGICKSIDEQRFISEGKVIKLDNTFNIQLDNDVSDYYDAIELIASQGRKGKIDIYSDDKRKCSGIVLGKDTSFLQKITLYNKLTESKVVCSNRKYIGIPYSQAIEMEYGMKHIDFIEYFKDKIRVELRVIKKEQIRNFYTDIPKGDVMLEDILSSTNNAISYQWNQFVKEKDTKEAIDFLSLQLEDKKNYKLSGYAKQSSWHYLKQFITHYDGDDQKVIDVIKKLHYTDKDGTPKKLSGSVRTDIIKWCAEYRQNKQRASKGQMFSVNLLERYDEIKNKIENL